MTNNGFSASGRPIACCLLIKVQGELDLATVSFFEGEVQRTLNEARHIVVDARKLTFMDSTGVGAFLRLATTTKGGFALAGAPGTVRRIIEITGIDHLLPVLPSVRAARRFLHQRANPSVAGAANN